MGVADKFISELCKYTPLAQSKNFFANSGIKLFPIPDPSVKEGGYVANAYFYPQESDNMLQLITQSSKLLTLQPENFPAALSVYSIVNSSINIDAMQFSEKIEHDRIYTIAEFRELMGTQLFIFFGKQMKYFKSIKVKDDDITIRIVDADHSLIFIKTSDYVESGYAINEPVLMTYRTQVGKSIEVIYHTDEPLTLEDLDDPKQYVCFKNGVLNDLVEYGPDDSITFGCSNGEYLEVYKMHNILYNGKMDLYTDPYYNLTELNKVKCNRSYKMGLVRDSDEGTNIQLTPFSNMFTDYQAQYDGSDRHIILFGFEDEPMKDVISQFNNSYGLTNLLKNHNFLSRISYMTQRDNRLSFSTFSSFIVYLFNTLYKDYYKMDIKNFKFNSDLIAMAVPGGSYAWTSYPTLPSWFTMTSLTTSTWAVDTRIGEMALGSKNTTRYSTTDHYLYVPLKAGQTFTYKHRASTISSSDRLTIYVNGVSTYTDYGLTNWTTRTYTAASDMTLTLRFSFYKSSTSTSTSYKHAAFIGGLSISGITPPANFNLEDMMISSLPEYYRDNNVIKKHNFKLNELRLVRNVDELSLPITDFGKPFKYPHYYVTMSKKFGSSLIVDGDGKMLNPDFTYDDGETVHMFINKYKQRNKHLTRIYADQLSHNENVIKFEVEKSSGGEVILYCDASLVKHGIENYSVISMNPATNEYRVLDTNNGGDVSLDMFNDLLYGYLDSGVSVIENDFYLYYKSPGTSTAICSGDFYNTVENPNAYRSTLIPIANGFNVKRYFMTSPVSTVSKELDDKAYVSIDYATPKVFTEFDNIEELRSTGTYYHEVPLELIKVKLLVDDETYLQKYTEYGDIPFELIECKYRDRDNLTSFYIRDILRWIQKEYGMIVDGDYWIHRRTENMFEERLPKTYGLYNELPFIGEFPDINTITGMAIDRLGKHIAISTSGISKVHLFKIDTDKWYKMPTPVEDIVIPIASMVFSKNGKYIKITDILDNVYGYSIENDLTKLSEAYIKHIEGSVGFENNDHTLFDVKAGSHPSYYDVYNKQTTQVHGRLEIERMTNVTSLSVSKDGYYIITKNPTGFKVYAMAPDFGLNPLYKYNEYYSQYDKPANAYGISFPNMVGLGSDGWHYYNLLDINWHMVAIFGDISGVTGFLTDYDKSSLLVFVNGRYMHPSEYTIINGRYLYVPRAKSFGEKEFMLYYAMGNVENLGDTSAFKPAKWSPSLFDKFTNEYMSFGLLHDNCNISYDVDESAHDKEPINRPPVINTDDCMVMAMYNILYSKFIANPESFVPDNTTGPILNGPENMGEFTGGLLTNLSTYSSHSTLVIDTPVVYAAESQYILQYRLTSGSPTDAGVTIMIGDYSVEVEPTKYLDRYIYYLPITENSRLRINIINHSIVRDVMFTSNRLYTDSGDYDLLDKNEFIEFIKQTGYFKAKRLTVESLSEGTYIDESYNLESYYVYKISDKVYRYNTIDALYHDIGMYIEGWFDYDGRSNAIVFDANRNKYDTIRGII